MPGGAPAKPARFAGRATRSPRYRRPCCTEQVPCSSSNLHGLSNQALTLPVCAGPLFDGDQCRMTVAAAILVLQDLGGCHNFSKLALDELYQLLADQLLPIGNRLPRSFYKVAKALSSFGVTYSQVPACPADCALLEKQHQDATQCPVCEVDVMLSSKVFHRSSLITSLRRMFLSPDVSRLLRAHQQAPAGSGRLHDVWGMLSVPTCICWSLRHDMAVHKLMPCKRSCAALYWPAQGQMHGDGRRVEELRHKYPDFFADRRNILLGVCIDGLNPHNSGTVSITPIVLQVFNLPPEVSIAVATSGVPRSHRNAASFQLHFCVLRLLQGMTLYQPCIFTAAVIFKALPQHRVCSRCALGPATSFCTGSLVASASPRACRPTSSPWWTSCRFCGRAWTPSIPLLAPDSRFGPCYWSRCTTTPATGTSPCSMTQVRPLVLQIAVACTSSTYGALGGTVRVAERLASSYLHR